MTIHSSSEPAMVSYPPECESPVEVLRRWQAFGATWRVLSRTPAGVTLALCRCDGGEEVQRISSADPELIDWLAGRQSSEQ